MNLVIQRSLLIFTNRIEKSVGMNSAPSINQSIFQSSSEKSDLKMVIISTNAVGS